MTEEPYWIEMTRRVGSDDWDGDCIEIQPSSEGTGCVEIRYRRMDGTFADTIDVPPKCAYLLAKAIMACADEMLADPKRYA